MEINARSLRFIFLLVLLVHQANALVCLINSDCADSEFCNGSAVCETIQYSPVVATDGSAASSDLSQSFSLLLITDIQYFFTNPKGEPVASCVFDLNVNKRANKKALRAAAKRQRQCIKHVVEDLTIDVIALFDLGDLTNEGLTNEVNSHASFMADIQYLGLPQVFMLGNHDYAMYPGEPGVRLIEYLEENIKTFHPSLKLRNVDFETTAATLNVRTGHLERYTRGSLCFSIEINGYLFILMHWSTAHSDGPYTTSYSSYDANTNTDHFIQITTPKQWIRDELADATASGLDVILMPHSWEGLTVFLEQEQDFDDDLQESSLIAVISGHVHDAYGKHGDWTITGSNGIKTVPVYYAGSTSYEKFIVAKLAPFQGGLTVDTYDSSGSNQCTISASTSPDERTCSGTAKIDDVVCV